MKKITNSAHLYENINPRFLGSNFRWIAVNSLDIRNLGNELHIHPQAIRFDFTADWQGWHFLCVRGEGATGVAGNGNSA